MDNIFRLKGRSFAFVGSGEVTRVAEERLRANAEADGYDVHWIPREDGTMVGPADVIEFRDTVRLLANMTEERLRGGDGGLYEGPRSFYYLGMVNPFIREREYEELVTVARLSRYSGVSVGVRTASLDVGLWMGVPVYAGRIVSGGMMAWELVQHGDLL